MIEVMKERNRAKLWYKLKTEGDKSLFKEIFKNYRATVDWPGASFYKVSHSPHNHHNHHHYHYFLFILLINLINQHIHFLLFSKMKIMTCTSFLSIAEGINGGV